jgi:hypothetical protein
MDTYHQAQRIGSWWIAKTLMGNARSDTGGTLHFAWTTNFKALNLQVGQIVRMSSVHDNISNQLVRLSSVKPSPNCETVELEGDWHEDYWYEDTFGTLGFTMITNPARGTLFRPPFPWLPNEMAPTSFLDPMVSQTTFGFDLAQAYPLDASNNVIAVLTVTGQQPINTFSSTAGTPLLRSACSVNPTGGTLKCGYLYSLCVVAQDANGYSRPSYVVNVPIATGGTNTNSITLTDVSWNGGTNYSLFAGIDPNKMCFQSTATQSSSVVMSALLDQTWGLPDVDFNSLSCSIKRVQHGGILGDPILSVGTHTLQASDGGWTVNECAGRVASIMASVATQNTLQVLKYSITSNTIDTLTVTGTPLADGVGVGDALVIRTLATTFSASTIGDALFINATEGGLGLTVNAEAGNLVRIIAGTGKNTTLKTIQSNTTTVLAIEGTFDITPDATSIVIIEDGTWLDSFETDTINNSDPTSQIQINLRIDN